MTERNLNDIQYEKLISDYILEEGVEVSFEDFDILMLRLVKKHRKLSGDRIQEMKDKMKELAKKKYKLEKNF